MQKVKKWGAWLLSAVLTWLIKKILDATGIYESITMYFQKPEIKNQAINFLNKSLPLWKVLIYLALFGVFVFLARLIYKLFLGKEARQKKEKINSRNKKEALRAALRADNKRMVGDNEIEIRYTVDINEFDDSVEVYDLVPYCAKHDFPIKMSIDRFTDAYKCAIPGCTTTIHNPTFATDTHLNRIRNIILSELQHKWAKMNQPE